MEVQDLCKLDYVVDRHNLNESVLNYDSIDERILARWKGTDGAEADGYRTLTEWFNKNLMRTVYDKHGRDTTGTRVDSDYDALMGEDEILQQEVRDDLETDGIDPAQLCGDMVSWSTMRSHLNECLDSEKEVETSETDWEQNSVQIAKGVAADKAEKAVSSLISKDIIQTTAPVDVKVMVLVTCQECPTRLPLDAAIERGFVCMDHQ